MVNLSDAQLQFPATDRLSFKCFLSFTEADKAPDEKTIWAFREVLVTHGLRKRAFEGFNEGLEQRGLFARQGQMVAATFVEVPRQRNSRQDNSRLRAGQVPEERVRNPKMLRQKDLNAHRAKKNQEQHYGYKNHVKVDSKSKLISDFTVTDAAVHDSQALDDLRAQGDPTTYVDSAYTGSACEAIFDHKGVLGKVIERAYRNQPLTTRQRRRNRAKSRIRVRVEHVFGAMRMCLRASWNRCIGKRRNQGAIAMGNLVYNLIRYEQIERLDLRTW